MKLYHWLSFIILPGFWLIVSGCTAPRATQALISISLNVDKRLQTLEIQAGSTVDQAISKAGVDLSALDKLDPPGYTILTDQAQINVIRVRETFRVEQDVIPFEKQVLQTDSLPDQSRMIVQTGVNGLEEITYRQLFEEDVEVSSSPVKVVVIKEPVPEVVMVGVRSAYAPIAIPGKIAYISGNNAWLMEGTTADRRALITTGDLDGRIFTLSDDGNWLLFSRRLNNSQGINRLWVADTRTDPIKEINLNVDNVVHFADWIPGSNSKLVFSTVEPREAAPGWQANNDLFALSFSESGWTSNWKNKPVLEANSGGVYGWWGMDFIWSPSGDRLAYTRADSVGVLNFADGSITSLVEITPFQTGSDWAWSPGLDWSPDGRLLFTVEHDPPEVSTVFNLIAIDIEQGLQIRIAPQTGMFTYPIASPTISYNTGEEGYQIAYLQAIFPAQSDNSRYRMFVMDRDGSNNKLVYPIDNGAGLEPQQVEWSRSALPDTQQLAIGVIYEGNLWIVDVGGTLGSRQVTGDGLISKISWH